MGLEKTGIFHLSRFMRGCASASALALAATATATATSSSSPPRSTGCVNNFDVISATRDRPITCADLLESSGRTCERDFCLACDYPAQCDAACGFCNAGEEELCGEALVYGFHECLGTDAFDTESALSLIHI